MSNRAALYVFLAIALALGGALVLIDGAGLFLARKFIDLLQWLAVWR